MNIQDKLRVLIKDIRRKPISIATIIPLLQEAIDKIESLSCPPINNKTDKH